MRVLVDGLRFLFFVLTSKSCPCCSDDPVRCGTCPVCGGEGVVPLFAKSGAVR